jgi:anti-sigma factor ChrR (cupin superfamily)
VGPSDIDPVTLTLGARRLSGAIAELPLRYAPFFAQLAQLFDLPEADVERELGRARRQGFSLTLVPGVRSFTLRAGGRRHGKRARLLRLAPGAELPCHRHRGPERVLVLEGSYRDSNGTEVRAGGEQLMPAHSEHGLRASRHGPCVAAVVEQGIDFTGPLLGPLGRLLSHLLG